MSPRLVVVAGPLEGHVVPLEGELTIGRARSNTLVLTDEDVSRQHASLRPDGDTFVLEDLGSRHGTRVDGRPVTERRLAPGDRIQIGENTLVFAVDDFDADRTAGLPLDDDDATESATVELRLENARYLRPDATKPRGDERTVDDLAALVRIARAVGGIADPEALQDRVLELVLEAIPAERAALLLSVNGDGAIASTLVRDREGLRTEGPLRLSRTVVRRVLSEGVAVLSNDVRTTQGIALADSVAVLGLRAVLCVPLEAGGRRLGALYLHSSAAWRSFDEGHLELATAVASIAAVAIDNARRTSWLAAEADRLRADLDHDLVGESAAMRRVLDFVGKVAPKDSTVLVRGESGTGKELVARAMHRNSPRAARSFVAINCAALPENLLESELFGHEKGAFTGAAALKKGKVELADGGTLFLDEIGELAPLLQAKLLRVLQERELERVGGTKPIRVDVRLVAATNQDLEAAMREGRFRQDLFYRLNVVSLELPPLRERREDVPLLASHFVAKLCERFGRPPMALTPEARACLVAYDWPGNVRELQNALERAVVLASSDALGADDLPEALVDARPPGTAASGADFHEAVKAAKRELIRGAFEQAGGSYVETARLLGLNANYLHRLIKNLDLKDSLRTTDG